MQWFTAMRLSQWSKLKIDRGAVRFSIAFRKTSCAKSSGHREIVHVAVTQADNPTVIALVLPLQKFHLVHSILLIII
jgi:hypothetical protein